MVRPRRDGMTPLDPATRGASVIRSAATACYSSGMTRAESLPHYTYEEYVRFEEMTDAKHEYLDGRILAMAGGTPEHAILTASSIALLSEQLAGTDCSAASSDLRVRVLATGLATYPDVTVICGPLERDPQDRNAVVNPIVLVEVPSDGTEAYDRIEKASHYRRIPSLREYLLVSHRERRIERHARTASGEWTVETAGSGGAVRLDSIGAVLDVDAVYERSPSTASIPARA